MVCCSPQSRKKLDRVWRLNNNITKSVVLILFLVFLNPGLIPQSAICLSKSSNRCTRCFAQVFSCIQWENTRVEGVHSVSSRTGTTIITIANLTLVIIFSNSGILVFIILKSLILFIVSSSLLKFSVLTFYLLEYRMYSF